MQTQYKLLLCCSNVVQVPLSLNPFQLNLEFGTTHRVALCVVHPIEYMSCHHSLGATGATLNTRNASS